MKFCPKSEDCESFFDQTASEKSASPIWNCALFMARQGFKVLPLYIKSKEALLRGWPEKATDDENVIREWAELYPNHNYGVLTGNGWFVLDFDLDESDDIDKEIQRAQKKLGSFELGTMVKTGRGYQLYCASDGFDIRNSEKRLTEKVDVKGAGGYVVGPGSIHPNGSRYEICDSHTLKNGIRLTKLSQAALHYIVSLQGGRGAAGVNNKGMRGANSPENRVIGNALNYEKPISVGRRNTTLFRIGCHFREVHALQANDLYLLLKGINENDCEEPLADYDLIKIAESCCKYPPGEPRVEMIQTLSCEPCNEEVLDLFQGNQLIELFRQNVQKFHVGDWNVAELEMLSVASQSVVNTDGIQPKLSGESGKGKTHVSRTVLHLLDPSMYRAASFSSKVLFYDTSLKPKMVIFSDDVSLKEDVDEIVRAAMSNWDEATQRMTLDSKRNPVTLSLPPRISFWFTSVKTTTTMQLVNRQVEVNVDESLSQDKRVDEHQRRVALLGLPDFYVDDEVVLLRQAFLYLNQIDFKVKIPFVNKIRFAYVSNRRNLVIFFDLIRAYCLLNHRAREVDDSGALVATRDDFNNALTLFDTVAVQQITKLNERERQISEVIRNLSPCHAHEIKEEVMLSDNYIYDIIHGKRNSGNKGLLEKIPELVFYPKNDFNPNTGARWGRNHYALPKDWRVINSSQSIIYWEDNPDELRGVSHGFADELRNSEGGAESLDSSLGGVNGNIIHNTGTNVATSEENETSPIGNCPFLPQRSSEIESIDSPKEAIAPDKTAKDAKNAAHSISETQSEVERSDPKYCKLVHNTGNTVYQQKKDFQTDISLLEAKSIGTDSADGSEDLSQLPELINDYLIVVKEQQQSKKLKQDFLRVNVAWKVKDLSNNRYSLETIFDYYDRLNAQDSKISALISSICGGELDVRNS